MVREAEPGSGASGGSSVAHLSVATGQRVRKRQPEGKRVAEGTMPGMVARRSPALASTARQWRSQALANAPYVKT